MNSPLGEWNDSGDLFSLKGLVLSDSQYRQLLDCIANKCYVESWSTGQYGHVEKIIRNKYNLPVCLKVRTDEGQVDYISIDRVNFWEPWDYINSEWFYVDGEYEEIEDGGI